jgi:hypothetical protein
LDILASLVVIVSIRRLSLLTVKGPLFEQEIDIRQKTARLDDVVDDSSLITGPASPALPRAVRPAKGTVAQPRFLD